MARLYSATASSSFLNLYVPDAITAPTQPHVNTLLNAFRIWLPLPSLSSETSFQPLLEIGRALSHFPILFLLVGRGPLHSVSI